MIETQTSARTTRGALIASAIRLFGRNGYVGTSTREISADAGANVAAIGYHFGGKAGLREACAATIAARLNAVLAPATPRDDPDPESAERELEATVRAMVRFLTLDPEAGEIAAFMLREITDPSHVPQAIYDGLVEPRHRALCRLWAAATGSEPESETTRLSVFALMGQVVYFRIGQPLVVRRMGWDRVGADEAGRIAEVLVGNLHAALASARRAGG